MEVLNSGVNTSAFIQAVIKTTLDQMIQHQHNGEYVQAQKCRIKLQNNKKQLENKRLQEMNSRHRTQRKQMEKAHNEQMKNMSAFWSGKLTQFLKQGKRLLSELENKHQSDLQKTRQNMQGQLSLKVKQSSQLLNLRKMQEHMAKQKNYVEAHRVQQKVNKLYSQQRAAWMKQRQLKIQAALTNLRNKQMTQMNNLRQRIKTGEEQQRKDWHLQELRIIQKYENLLKQLKAQQQRETLSLKGEFKSKGGSSSPSIKSKVTMSSTNSSK